MGLPSSVVQTMQGARAPSTRALYAHRWNAFVRWCEQHDADPLLCLAPEILQFLQDLLEAGRSPSTLRGMVAAIKAARVGRYCLPEDVSTLVSRFLKGAQRCGARHVRPPLPSWDLELVLQAMEKAPFEPLATADLKWLSLKTALLLALASAKRVGELHALSVHQDLCRFLPEDAGVVLRPNPIFFPKVFTGHCSNLDISLKSLFSAELEDGTRVRSLVCPVRALDMYMARTRGHRASDQLFVCFKSEKLGQPLSKARLSHWLVDAIRQAYLSMGVQFPTTVRAHSTRGMAASWALWRGASLDEVCAAAAWSAPSTFARFYQLNVAASTSFGERVLGSALQF